MVRTVRRTWLAAVSATLGLATACNDSQGPRPQADLLPTGGALAAAATTFGSDIDPDGYLVRVDVTATQTVGSNGLATFTGLPDGEHRVDLFGVAANCNVQDNDPRSVNVAASMAGPTRFDVGCVSAGNVFVSASTTGVDLAPDGYTVTVDGSASQPLGTNGNVTLTGVPTGSHSVALSGIAANCSLNGLDPQPVTVTAGATAAVSFALNCAPTGSGSGTLTVATSTTGSNVDPDGYTLTLDGTASQPIGVNDAVTRTVPTGAHPVALSGLAANCAMSGANPTTVSVLADGTVTTTFAVTCSAQLPPPEVSGQGQLKMGSPTPGHFVQTFAVDVRADLTGRFTITDYSDLYPDGSAASLITDAVTDPATGVTAYRSSSSDCSDPSRGVEFDAVGRVINDGALVSYTVELCDNGPPGGGLDFVSFYLASKGYGRSGLLVSGDVVKQ